MLRAREEWVSRSPVDYETRRGTASRRPSAVRKWAIIVVVIALAVGGLWIGLFLLHWFSLGDMGP